MRRALTAAAIAVALTAAPAVAYIPRPGMLGARVRATCPHGFVFRVNNATSRYETVTFLAGHRRKAFEVPAFGGLRIRWRNRADRAVILWRGIEVASRRECVG